MKKILPSPGQSREFHSRLVQCAPDLDGELMRALNDASPKTIQEFLANLANLAMTLQVLLPFPAEGIEFELTLDGDESDPLAMVRNDRYTGDWKFLGSKVVGKQTRKFKLLRAGYQLNLDGVKQKLGPLAEGEWREAFGRVFRPAPCTIVGFGGSEWMSPGARRRFACLHECGPSWFSGFRVSAYTLGKHWFWLVPSTKTNLGN